MRILSIYKDENAETKARAEMIRDAGTGFVRLSPSMMSAFTAMKIAKAVDREDIDIVETYDSRNAMAAISARSIAKRKYKIVTIVAPNTPAPLAIPKEIRQGVDLWIFPSQRLNNEYPDSLKKCIVLTPVSFKITEPIEKNTNSEITISWIGEITAPDALKAAVDALEDSGGTFTLRIAGAGRAGAVMPVVRYARGINNAHKVIWASAEYNADEEIRQSHAVIQRGDDLTAVEAAALLSGRRVLRPEEIAAFLLSPDFTSPQVEYSAKNYVNHLVQSYASL